MTDEIDRAQDLMLQRQDELHERARAHGQNGHSVCACGEPITALRQQLGAVRCIECQQVHETIRGNRR